MKIDMSYGSGGIQTGKLIDEIFIKHFDNKTLKKLNDSAIVKTGEKTAFTTDSFVVTPLFFNGGDIGKLAVCGTVNDLAVSGAQPEYITAAFIIEEGTDIKTLDRIAASMAAAAKEAKVKIVAGDTKVIEGNGGVYINTSGVGRVIKPLSPAKCREGDVILLSGNLGEHHAAIMSGRMGIENNIKSDCAPLNSLAISLIKEIPGVRCMRDVTRGGLATVLNELCRSCGLGAVINENALPISREVSGFCGILGLDPLYMANEGKLVAVVSKKYASKALAVMRKNKYGKNAAEIGHITAAGGVVMRTLLSGTRKIDMLYGEGLPRIC